MQPAKGILHVFDDRWELDLGGQAIIKGNESVPLGAAKVEELARHASAAAHGDGWPLKRAGI
jgi:hypothetical protein